MEIIHISLSALVGAMKRHCAMTNRCTEAKADMIDRMPAVTDIDVSAAGCRLPSAGLPTGLKIHIFQNRPVQKIFGRPLRRPHRLRSPRNSSPNLVPHSRAMSDSSSSLGPAAAPRHSDSKASPSSSSAFDSADCVHIADSSAADERLREERMTVVKALFVWVMLTASGWIYISPEWIPLFSV